MYNTEKLCVICHHTHKKRDVSFYVVGFVTLVNIVNTFVG